jgi:metal-sulfur cluster biosynthetic enzyme
VSDTKEMIYNKLKEVIDPELGINIVDLGLIYKVEVLKEKKEAKVEMTFTTPACPMINYILADVEKKLNELEDIDIEVKVVFSPAWTPDLMSKEAKLKLGMI